MKALKLARRVGLKCLQTSFLAFDLVPLNLQASASPEGILTPTESVIIEWKEHKAAVYSGAWSLQA